MRTYSGDILTFNLKKNHWNWKALALSYWIWIHFMLYLTCFMIYIWFGLEKHKTGFIINWTVLMKLINQAGMLWWKYEDFLELSFKKLANTIKSNFLWSDNERCMKNQMLIMLMQLVAALGVFRMQQGLFRTQSNQVLFKR